jgi:cyclic lactone autoinducer peptide
MLKKATKVALVSMFSALILFAEIATSTSTFFMWHEPECPKELIK